MRCALLACAAAVLAPTESLAADPPGKPNVAVILTDDKYYQITISVQFTIKFWVVSYPACRACSCFDRLIH